MARWSKHLDDAWNTFQSEYLAVLRQREQGQHQKSKPTSTIKPGSDDVVLIHDENRKRGLWKIARIVKLHKGTDGECRGADVRLGNGKTVARSVKLLYPLEVGQQQQHDTTEQDEHGQSSKMDRSKTSTALEKEKPSVPRRSPRLNPVANVMNMVNILSVVVFAVASLTSPVASLSSNITVRPGECLTIQDKNIKLTESEECVTFGYAVYNDGRSNKL